MLLKYIPALIFAVFALLCLLLSIGGDKGAAMPQTLFIIPALFFGSIAIILAIAAWILSGLI